MGFVEGGVACVGRIEFGEGRLGQTGFLRFSAVLSARVEDGLGGGFDGGAAGSGRSFSDGIRQLSGKGKLLYTTVLE